MKKDLFAIYGAHCYNSTEMFSYHYNIIYYIIMHVIEM